MEKSKSLYVPQMEKDSCGTGLIANLNGNKTHRLVKDALSMLCCMEHRGAIGAEPNTGDGAGILTQIPHAFFKAKSVELGFQLPDFGKYGVGMLFLPNEAVLMEQCRVLLNDYLDELGFQLLGYRKVPVDNESLGFSAKEVEPRIEQVFIAPKSDMPPKVLERKLYVLRKLVTHNVHKTFPECSNNFYFCSASYKTIVYKGQLTTYQLPSYFPDLHDERYTSAIALIHSRFSTNTIPKWKLAQPFRYIAHNGEINTIQGNINWWKAKEQILASEIFSEQDLEYLHPIIGRYHSDSASFDNILEFLVMSGRSLPHALMMMIPEAWEEDERMPDYKRSFYEYHSNIMEAWDGPASITFTDGILVGATLDRNGLRPSRYCLLEDNTLIVASEAGALKVDQSKVVLKGRLQPGRMLIADMDEKRIIGDAELKEIVCRNGPYKDWLDDHRLRLDDFESEFPTNIGMDPTTLLTKQQLYGYTKEDLRVIISPMINVSKDPIGSMGQDIPLAVLSNRSQHLANYFKQLFAQVTNPPIDPIRERSVMSLFTKLGPNGDMLHPNANAARFIHLDSPILNPEQYQKVRHMKHRDFRLGLIDIVFNADGQKGRLEAAIDHICAMAEDLVRNKQNVIIITDQKANAYRAPIPSLLATGAIHHHLIRKGLRTQTSIVVAAGDIRETHHYATLIGYGANAIYPYLAYATIDNLMAEKSVY